MTQDQAFDILTMGYNVFLTGPAGTGKTYLVNRFTEYCHERNISIAITASTGIAATHIAGMTIHSWSGMGIRDTLSDDEIDDLSSRSYLTRRFLDTAVLIIDEVSMLSGNLLESLDRLLRTARREDVPFGGMQVLLVGDFFQLPPVARGVENPEFAFEHPAWKSLSLLTCVLTRQYRQVDDPLLDILSEIRSGTVSQKSIDLLLSRRVEIRGTDHTELFTRNQSVDRYNSDRLDQIQSDTFLFEMTAQGGEKLTEVLKKSCLAPEMLVLKEGARVMFVKNNFEAGYANGSIGHIIGRKDGFPIVELLDGSQILATMMSWTIEEDGKVKASISQVPLRLAWAITVHKSQGMTLDEAVVDLSDAFVAGQGYVALSRVRRLAGLTLRGINQQALEIDPRVIRYDSTAQATSDRIVSRLTAMSRDEQVQRGREAITRLGGIDIDRLSPEERRKISTQERHTKTPTIEVTRELLQTGKTVEAIAIIRGLTPATIIEHIEKLRLSTPDLDLSHLREDENEDRLAMIFEAFDATEGDRLAPIREYLGESFSYDEIRRARWWYRGGEASEDTIQ